MVQKLIGNFLYILTRKYLCLSGRAGQAEFWLWILALFIISTVLGFIPKIGSLLSGIWMLVAILPSWGVTVRRLHDRNKSGWMILIGLIPVIGIVILLIMCVSSRFLTSACCLQISYLYKEILC